MKSLGNLNDTFVAADIYSYSSDNEKSFIGTIGGEQSEKDVNFSSNNYDYFRFNQGTSIGFELRSAGSSIPDLSLKVDVKAEANGHSIQLINSETDELVLSLDAKMVTSFDANIETFRDITNRRRASDT